jgi:hypothetical protein
MHQTNMDFRERSNYIGRTAPCIHTAPPLTTMRRRLAIMAVATDGCAPARGQADTDAFTRACAQYPELFADPAARDLTRQVETILRERFGWNQPKPAEPEPISFV